MPADRVAAIPMPIQVVIDDVGWWSGQDGHERNQPYRTGIARHHVPADYGAIAYLGAALHMRPQAAMVMCEWDIENILSDLPSSTWMGADWDNRQWLGPWLDEAADIIRSNRHSLELALHGIGHEYWADGTMERAEWHDAQGRMRSPDKVEAHLDYFARLLDQHGLGPFPKSFVPAAFLHRFGPSEQHHEDFATILARHGVTCISTPFEGMYNAPAADHGVFGYDADVMTIDRGHDLMPWYVIGQGPSGALNGPICGMHWPNLLHADPARNLDIVEKWIAFLQPYDERIDTTLAANTNAFRAQLAHHTCTRLTIDGNSLLFDFTETARLPEHLVDGDFLLKFDGIVQAPITTEGLDLRGSEVQYGHGGPIHLFEFRRDPGTAQGKLVIDQ